ncbi:bifunctional UDP-sugar hydrolase/5'-nucleotidase [Halovivax sp.]|uniref:bifunctional metallophosphatase/5'-nucleotidase n=1 Tax=Halovivax sp. TaxID=1935978 RepID=UPI0025BB9346|nr:bifunctional UDP-sugar hydrolase/5'-nucleotidase [Halovivax sp.]
MKRSNDSVERRDDSDEPRGDPDGRFAQSRREFVATTAGVSLGAAGAIGAAGTAGATSGDTLTIVHDTHFHGRFEDAADPEKNVARYHTMVDALRDEHENAIFLGIGDDLAPSLLGLEFQGEHVIPALNYMEPAAIGVGNHEFDFGADVAIERFEESTFPWVVANLLTDEGEPIPGTERWTTIAVGDVTVGVFGLGTDNFHAITDYPDDWQVLDTIEAAEAAVDALRNDEGADFVVGALHLSTGRQREVADAVDGLDAIVGSHSGTLFEEPEVRGDGTVLSEFDDEFDHLGRLTFDVASGELVDWERVDFYNGEFEDPPSDHENHRPVDVHDVEEDEFLREHADEWIADLEERLGRPFFESAVELDATFDTNYARESRWGNLMTDVMREVGGDELDVDVAIQNAGGIRSNATYGPGEITGLDVMNVLPFPNEIEVVEVTGEVLSRYLEDVTRPLSDGSTFGAQPAIQVSGLQYEWRGHDGESELLSAFVGGEPLAADDTYLVASNDFEIGRSILGEEGEIVVHSGQYLGPFVLDRLEERGTVDPEIEGRILRVDEDVGEHREVVRRRGETLLRFPVPEGAEAIEGVETFYALAEDYERLEPASVSVEGDDLWIGFRTSDLQPLVAGDDDLDLRVFGGFDPDEEYYDYRDDGELMELPVAATWDYFKLKATVDTTDPSLRPD